MNRTTLEVSDASLVVVPSGRDYERCLTAFEDEFGVTVPRFKDRRLTVESQDGRVYKRVKSKDVPAYIADGSADIGLTGTDVCEEYIPEGSNVQYKAIGEPMCTFSLLLPNDAKAAALVARLSSSETEPVRIATSYPRFLWRCIKRAQQAGQHLNVSLDSFRPSGSVEALVGWKTEVVADIVESGETAQANGLRKGPDLAVISPAVVWRDPNKPPAPISRNFFNVDETLAQRAAQVSDRRVSSYTLDRLRNPNQALKDYGEESAEYLDAVLRGSDSAADELADLVFAGLVLSRANGGGVTLAQVMQILETRSTTTSLQQKG